MLVGFVYTVRPTDALSLKGRSAADCGTIGGRARDCDGASAGEDTWFGFNICLIPKPPLFPCGLALFLPAPDAVPCGLSKLRKSSAELPAGGRYSPIGPPRDEGVLLREESEGRPRLFRPEMDPRGLKSRAESRREAISLSTPRPRRSLGAG